MDTYTVTMLTDCEHLLDNKIYLLTLNLIIFTVSLILATLNSIPTALRPYHSLC